MAPHAHVVLSLSDHRWHVIRPTLPLSGRPLVAGALDQPWPADVHSRWPADAPSGSRHWRSRILLDPQPERIRIGPFLGILTLRDAQGRLRGNHGHLAAICQTARRLGGIAFVFTPDDVDRTTMTVTGRLPHRGRWIEAPLPLPHVVYNRIPYRQWEQRPGVQAFLTWLTKRVHLFNRSFFDKWQLTQWLGTAKSLRALLPDTARATLGTLRAFLARYPTVYLKPCGGKAGVGILRVTKTPAGYKAIGQSTNGTRKTAVFRRFEELASWCRRWIGDVPYLIQQGIELANVNGQRFDLRALVQKDGSGQWQLTGVGARVAPAGGITTHVPQGGHIGNPRLLLARALPSHAASHVQDQLRAVALTVARTLERHMPGLAECSMDFGVDRHGKLWFFEANAKPMTFDEPTIQRRALETRIRYAQWAAGFRTGGTPQ